MQSTNKNPLDIDSIVQKIGTSEAYVRARNDVESTETTDGDRRRAAIRIAATALKGEQTSGYLSPEGHAMNITAQLTTFNEAYQVLNRAKREQIGSREKNQARRKVSEFFHAVKDMVDSNPSLQFNDVSSFILTMNQVVNGRASSGPDFEHEVRTRLVGMRHEIAAEQMLGYMPDVEYRESTIDEDLKGADLFISIDGSPMTRVDIKASKETAERERDNALRNGYSAGYIVWSHVENDEFNGSFRISNELAAERSVALYSDLQQVVRVQKIADQRSVS